MSRCDARHSHPSRGEAEYCNHLHHLQSAGLIRNLKINPTIPLWPRRRYKADFGYETLLATDGNWRQIVDEYKGPRTCTWELVKKRWPKYGCGYLRETFGRRGNFYSWGRDIPGQTLR